MALGLGAAMVLLGATGVGVANATQSGDGVPEKFDVEASSWTSNDEGQVLGTTPCGQDSCPVLLSTDDAGDTWTEVELPVSNEINSFFDIETSAVEGESTWVAQGAGSTYFTYFVSTDEGKTWEKTDFGVPDREATEISQVGEYVYAATSVSGDYHGVEYVRARVGTQEWELVPELSKPDVIHDGSDFAAQGSTGMIMEWYRNTPVGDPGTDRLLTTTDGENWTVRKDSDFCPSSLSGWENSATVGSEMRVLCSPGIDVRGPVLQWDDESESFSRVGWTPNLHYDAAAYDDTLAVATTGDSTGCAIESSPDGGKTWERTLTVESTLDGPEDLEFTDENTGTVLCDIPDGYYPKADDVYRTTDGGKTWEPLGL